MGKEGREVWERKGERLGIGRERGLGKEGREAWKEKGERLEKGRQKDLEKEDRERQEESEKRCKFKWGDGLVVNCCQQNMLREKNMLLRKNWLVQIGIHVNI